MQRGHGLLRILRFLGIFFIGLFLVAGGWLLAANEREYQTSSKKITAVITGGVQGRREVLTGRLDYSYVVGDKTYTGSGKVSASEFDKAEIGGPLVVTYLPTAPSSSRTSLEESSLIGYGTIALGVFTMLIGGLGIRLFLAKPKSAPKSA